MNTINQQRIVDPFKKMLSSADVAHALNWSWAGLNFLSWWHTCIIFIWPFNALVPGFSNGFLHIVPIAWEILNLKIISLAINGFGADGVGTAKDVRTKMQVILISIVILVIAIGFNVAQALYTLITTNQNSLMIDSTLYWFLTVFSIVLLVLAILEAIEIYYLAKLKKHIGLLTKVKSL